MGQNFGVFAANFAKGLGDALEQRRQEKQRRADMMAQQAAEFERQKQFETWKYQNTGGALNDYTKFLGSGKDLQGIDNQIIQRQNDLYEKTLNLPPVQQPQTTQPPVTNTGGEIQVGKIPSAKPFFPPETVPYLPVDESTGLPKDIGMRLPKGAIIQQPSQTKEANDLKLKDTEAIVERIADGSFPPTELDKLGRGYVSLVSGGLARKGVNLTTLRRDWIAITKHLASLNNPQQLRLGQVLDAVEMNIPEAVKLSNELVRTKIKPLNWVELKSLSMGIGTEKATVTMQRYASQMVVMRDELAVALQGGGTPTEYGMKMAEELLPRYNGKVMTEAALDQLHRNIRIRKTALTSSGAMGLGGEVNNPPLTGTGGKPSTGGQPQGQVPSVGGNFNGEKVLSVEKIQ